MFNVLIVSYLQLSDEPQKTSQPHNSSTPSSLLPLPAVHCRPDTEAPPPPINSGCVTVVN